MIEPQRKLAKVGRGSRELIPDFLITKIGDDEVKKVIGVVEVKRYVSGRAEKQVQKYCRRVRDLGEAHGVFRAFQVGEEIHGYDSMGEEVVLKQKDEDEDEGLAEYLLEVLKDLKAEVEVTPAPSTTTASVPDTGGREISS